MQQLKKNLFIFLMLFSACSYAQNKDAIKNYIETYKDLAIREMIRTGVPASITLAQGIHESGAGNSKLAVIANNHFGIKCKSNWTGESMRHDDDAKGECFRKYVSAEDSYKDHSDFLKNGTRYASLFTLDPEDYTGWANGLKQAGYATNPKYPQVLIKMVEEYGLQQYSLIALGKMPDPDSKWAVTTAKLNTEIPASTIETKVVIQEKVPIDYPSGQFHINDTKVIYATKGTPFLAIAKKYDVDLSKLFEFNELEKTEQLENDQLIFLQRKRKTGNNEFHTVMPGETMYDIAQAEAIRLESLLELNKLHDGERPAVGEKLYLKTKAPSMPALAVKGNFSLIPGQSPK